MVTNRILKDPRSLRLFKSSEIHNLFVLDDEDDNDDIQEETSRRSDPSHDGHLQENEDPLLGMLLDATGVSACKETPMVSREAKKIAETSLRMLKESKEEKSSDSGTSILERLKHTRAQRCINVQIQHPLVDRLRLFLLGRGGSASTEAILKEFEPQVLKKEKTLFKKILFDLAEKSTVRGSILWTLRDM